MAKEALIKVRCSADLKRRLEKIAFAKGEQSVSSFVRAKLMEVIPALEASVGIVHEAAAPYVTKPAKKSRRRRPDAATTATAQSLSDLARRDAEEKASRGRGTKPHTPRG